MNLVFLLLIDFCVYDKLCFSRISPLKHPRIYIQDECGKEKNKTKTLFPFIHWKCFQHWDPESSQKKKLWKPFFFLNVQCPCVWVEYMTGDNIDDDDENHHHDDQPIFVLNKNSIHNGLLDIMIEDLLRWWHIIVWRYRRNNQKIWKKKSDRPNLSIIDIDISSI